MDGSRIELHEADGRRQVGLGISNHHVLWRITGRAVDHRAFGANPLPLDVVVGQLAGDRGHAFVSLDQHRLVTRGVPRCREESNARDDLVLTVDAAVGRPRELDPIEYVEIDALRPVCVAAGMGHVPLGLLHEDRDAGKQRVPADVVEVEMAVDHGDDLVDVRADRPKFVGDGTALRPIGMVDERVAFADSGIDQHQTSRMSYGKGVDDTGLTGERMKAREGHRRQGERDHVIERERTDHPGDTICDGHGTTGLIRGGLSDEHTERQRRNKEERTCPRQR